jgi:hypothetical protein
MTNPDVCNQRKSEGNSHTSVQKDVYKIKFLYIPIYLYKFGKNNKENKINLNTKPNNCNTGLNVVEPPVLQQELPTSFRYTVYSAGIDLVNKYELFKGLKRIFQ